MFSLIVLSRRTPGPLDTYGNDTWAESLIDVPNCVIWPNGSSETDQGRDTVITGLTVLMPHGTVVKATDQVLVAGERYDIEGESFDWVSPLTGDTAGIEVHVVRATG